MMALCLRPYRKTPPLAYGTRLFPAYACVVWRRQTGRSSTKRLSQSARKHGQAASALKAGGGCAAMVAMVSACLVDSGSTYRRASACRKLCSCCRKPCGTRCAVYSRAWNRRTPHRGNLSITGHVSVRHPGFHWHMQQLRPSWMSQFPTYAMQMRPRRQLAAIHRPDFPVQRAVGGAVKSPTRLTVPGGSPRAVCYHPQPSPLPRVSLGGPQTARRRFNAAVRGGSCESLMHRARSMRTIVPTRIKIDSCCQRRGRPRA